MKPENMKLLDLQTGKYLELGKDFYYGGGQIILMENLKNDIEENCKFAIKNVLERNDYETSFHANTHAQYKSEPQGILKTLCDKTSAVIYGDRYVLLNGERDTSIHDDNHFYKIGDVVVNEYNCYGCVTIGLCSTEYSYHNNVVDIPELRGNCESGVLCCKFEILGNLFEEYSKQLRKEENKFDELMEQLK